MLAEAFTQSSTYVMAHADDSQLFMQPQMYLDLTSEKSKVVFIITTAGDAGFEERFWRAREEGMKSSVRLCLAPLGQFNELTGTNEFNGHKIHFWRAKNSVVYFLRLPDGNLDNAGFASNQFECLEKLRSGKITGISAIDRSTSYSSWEDLQNTIKEIAVSESKDIKNRWLNYLNPDTSKNPNDHPDHINTGLAVESILPSDGFQKALFTGYGVVDKNDMLKPTEIFWKSAMFAVYEKAVFDASGYSTLREDRSLYAKWCTSSAEIITVL